MMCNEYPNHDYRQWLRAFVSLSWYEEAVKFIFNFVSKTSELLLAAGIVVSTANFLTDGDVMSHNKARAVRHGPGLLAGCSRQFDRDQVQGFRDVEPVPYIPRSRC
jgi:hypothetical protein